MTSAKTAANDAGRPVPLQKRLQANVRRLLLDSAMLPADGRIVVAVSGGADSTALLLILARVAKVMRLSLHVAHFDHGLRGGEASQRDEAFVQDLAELLCLPLSVGRGDVRAVAKRERLSLEDAARRERYAFLERVAQETGASAVATGHTASDQAETVLLHLVRGAGLAGLAGMAPKAAWPFPGHESLSLLRPLLRLSRNETLAYCDAACIRPLEDESNASPAFRRNRVRHEVLPLLRELNPRIDDALVRVADAAAQDEAYIDSVAAEALAQPEGGRVDLKRSLLADWPAALRRHALRLALERLAGDVQEFSERHFAALERLALDGKTGDRLDLPRGVSATLTRSALRLRLGEEAPRSLPDAPVSLAAPGEARFGPLIVAASAKRPHEGVWAEVDAEAVTGGFRVRRRHAGDRFQPLGMQAAKRLQDFLVDAHVPRTQRDTLPLFESSDGIVWVGGLRIADWAKPRPGHATLFLSYWSVSS
jgi:tRNA(Ile)-lysidine synthase